MGHHGGRGTTAAAMVHVNSQLDAKSTYVSYRELLPRGKTACEQFLRPVAGLLETSPKALRHTTGGGTGGGVPYYRALGYGGDVIRGVY